MNSSLTVDALWCLCGVALMIGTLYAVVVPTKIDKHLGTLVVFSKFLSAIMSGLFLSLLAIKQAGFHIPSIELAALIAFLAGSGPAIVVLLVSLAPEFVRDKLGIKS